MNLTRSVFEEQRNQNAGSATERIGHLVLEKSPRTPKVMDGVKQLVLCQVSN